MSNKQKSHIHRRQLHKTNKNNPVIGFNTNVKMFVIKHQYDRSTDRSGNEAID